MGVKRELHRQGGRWPAGVWLQVVPAQHLDGATTGGLFLLFPGQLCLCTLALRKWDRGARGKKRPKEKETERK